MNKIVTIGRQFGSGGYTIGKMLAERLGVTCYDKELLNLAAKESGLAAEVVETHDEKPINSFFYSLVVDNSVSRGINNYVDLPLNQRVFLAQFETIQNIAKKESCVIIGRCADYALADFPDVTNIFICANLSDRVKRIAKRFEVSDDKAMDMITKNDKKRSSYYNYYSDKKWGVANTYDLTLNSSNLTPESAVELILSFLKARDEKRDDILHV